MSNPMSHNHYEKILSMLHVSDKMNLDKQDKMSQIRQFHDMIAKSCIENWPNFPDLYVDKSMLLYYG